MTELELLKLMYEDLEFTNNEFCELIRKFIVEDDNLVKKFYGFLKGKSDESPYAIDLLTKLYEVQSNAVRKTVG